MTITTEQVKELRDKTGISVMQCKKALEEAGGDMVKAVEALKAKGTEIAMKKSARTMASGAIAAYLHSNGKMGSLVEVHSETDFVANNAEFRQLADDIAMHAAAMDPLDVDELLTQPYIKDPSQTISDLVKGAVQKFGERIEIIRFARFDTAASKE